MACLYRLFLATIVLFASAGAMALQPITVPAWSLDGVNFFTSKSAACSSLDTATQWPGATASFVSVSGLLCRYGVTFPGNPQEFQHLQLQVGSKSTCPANAIETAPGACACAANYIEENGQCKAKPSCPDGQHEEGGACVPNNCKPNETRINGVCVPEPPCPPGETRVNGVCKKNGCEPGKSLGEFETNGQATTFYCEPYGGKDCMVRVNPSVCVTHDGNTSCWGTGKMTGGTCTPGSKDPGTGDGGGSGDGDGGGSGDGDGSGNGPGDGDADGPGDGPTQPPVPPVPPVPPDPGTGQCPPGTVRYSNGNCYPPTPAPTDPDGDGKCPPGTVKVGSKCVYPSPPGKPVPDTGTPENPNPGGGDGDGDGDEGSRFNGSCIGGFTCQGDAIQCAIAREQHQTNCKLLDTKNVDSFWKSAIDGTDPDSASNLRERADKVNVGMLDQQGFGWSRACPADPTFEVVGKSFSIPFSKVCGVLSVLSMAALGLTVLSCLMWVVGRKD